MGPSIVLVSSCLPYAWITFTLALTVVALKIFFMEGLDFVGVVMPTVILFEAFPDSTTWSGSLTYLLRCHFLISFSTINFRLQRLSVSCPWSL